MILIFENKYLKEIYETGSCTDKKHWYQPLVVKKYVRTIDYLKWASRKEDLFLIRSLHFEALKGSKSGLYSVRVDKQYRIEFSLHETDNQMLLTICNIIELSNHYD